MTAMYRDPIERSTSILTSCAHCGAEKRIMVNAGDFMLGNLVKVILINVYLILIGMRGKC